MSLFSTMRNLCPNLLNLPIFGHGSPDHERRPPFDSLAFPKISRKRSRRSSFAARQRHRSSRDCCICIRSPTNRRKSFSSRFRFSIRSRTDRRCSMRCVLWRTAFQASARICRRVVNWMPKHPVFSLYTFPENSDNAFNFIHSSIIAENDRACI